MSLNQLLTKRSWTNLDVNSINCDTVNVDIATIDTLVAPTVNIDATSIQGRSVTGAPTNDQGLSWDGAAWITGPVNCSQIQGENLNAATPIATEALVYNAGNAEWEPDTLVTPPALPNTYGSTAIYRDNTLKGYINGVQNMPWEHNPSSIKRYVQNNGTVIYNVGAFAKPFYSHTTTIGAQYYYYNVQLEAVCGSASLYGARVSCRCAQDSTNEHIITMPSDTTTIRTFRIRGIVLINLSSTNFEITHTNPDGGGLISNAIKPVNTEVVMVQCIG